MLRGECEQPRRQLAARSCPKSAALVDRSRVLRQSRALPRNPTGVTPRECLCLAARPSLRNRHAHAAIWVDAKHVASGAAVPDEIGFDGFNGFNGFNGLNRFPGVWFAERKSQLHPMRE